MQAGLRAAIYTRLITVSGLTSANTFFSAAPQDAAEPYCVFDSVANPNESDSVDRWEIDYFDVSLYGPSLAALESIEAGIETAIDRQEAAFSVTGYTMIDMRLIARPVKRHENLNTWKITLSFKSEMQRN